MVNKYKYIVQCNFQDLSEAQMQKIAAEMNLSETVFLRNKEKNGSFSKGITIAEVQCTSTLVLEKKTHTKTLHIQLPKMLNFKNKYVTCYRLASY